ncbi:MAG: RNA polymerase sigma-70 factor (ECF subfamily) [Saprospiraceae bacterium]|jgi:RNA polymerase sigma-70 factor (ECF subfamily)
MNATSVLNSVIIRSTILPSLDSLDNDDIVKRLASGNESAYKQVFDAYYRPLVISAYQILKNESLSKDAAQEVFLELWKNRARLTTKISLLPYLKRSVMNRALNIIKSRKHHISAGAEPLNILKDNNRRPDENVEDNEFVDHVHKAIESMPDRCRAIFMACKMQGLSHAEIASELGISKKTIENQITKALKIIRSEVVNYRQHTIILIPLISLILWGISTFDLLSGYDL